jgi:putative RecB family exonuclease
MSIPTMDLTPAATSLPTSAVADAPGRPAAGSADDRDVDTQVDASADEPRPRWLSVSSTREYERCPRRYRYAYVDRLPQDRHVPPGWRIGTAVHAALEAAYRHRMEHADAPTMAGLPAALVALRRSWDELELSHDDDRYPRAGRQVARTLAVDVLGRRPVLGVEMPLRDESDADRRIVGMVDLALRLGPTTVQIVDHKVTAWRARPQTLAADLQLNLYGTLAKAVWPETTTVIATHHYPTGPEAVSVRLSDDAMAAARSRVLDVGRTAAADDVYEPRPASHCDHCPWRVRCPAG